MNIYKELISGNMPMLPKAAINISDFRDVAHIHVEDLENKATNGKRFMVSTEQVYSFQQMVQILKANDYDKVSARVAPNFLLKFPPILMLISKEC